jgi:hypothetical protein
MVQEEEIHDISNVLKLPCYIRCDMDDPCRPCAPVEITVAKASSSIIEKVV